MKIERLLFLALLLALLGSLSMVLACGDDDDDDDDDDASADDDDDASSDDDDDDSSGSGSAYDDCVNFYTECAGQDAATAEEYCGYINDYSAYWNECFDGAFADYFDCLNGICDNYTSGGAEECTNQLYSDILGCY